MVALSMARALPAPSVASMASTVRRAVMKLGSRSVKVRGCSAVCATRGAGRSMRPPPGTRPAVRWLNIALEPEPPEAPKPPRSTAPCATAYTWRSAA